MHLTARLCFAISVGLLVACGGGGGGGNSGDGESATGGGTDSGSNNNIDPIAPVTVACNGLASLAVSAVSDSGSSEVGFGPEKTLDTSLSNASRWSAVGSMQSISYDLGAYADVKEIAIAWYLGDQSNYSFSVETSIDNSQWDGVLTERLSGGASSDPELYDLRDSVARYVRIIANGNTIDNSNGILEVDIRGCDERVDPLSFVISSDAVQVPTLANLDPAQPPSVNFDLGDWYLSIPSDIDGSGTADSIFENELNSGYENFEFFYTGADGGMVFRCPAQGFKTSTNTNYVRVELREMLRRGDTRFSTRGIGENNWVFGSMREDIRQASGGVDGVLRATLAVNRVTHTGLDFQVGRVIIGQIHATDDEPVRLYYRKLPGNTHGSIYIAHEINDGDDTYYELIGSRSNSASNPADGIALDELFSYQIKVVGHRLTVTIMRPGKADSEQVVDMSDSGYDAPDQFQYFKAGVYHVNNSADVGDYVQATFYALENTHDN